MKNDDTSTKKMIGTYLALTGLGKLIELAMTDAWKTAPAWLGWSRDVMSTECQVPAGALVVLAATIIALTVMWFRARAKTT